MGTEGVTVSAAVIDRSLLSSARGPRESGLSAAARLVFETFNDCFEELPRNESQEALLCLVSPLAVWSSASVTGEFSTDRCCFSAYSSRIDSSAPPSIVAPPSTWTINTESPSLSLFLD